MSYKVIKYRFRGKRTTIKTGLTLKEAQAICEREDTHGDGWFYGWTKE